MVAVNEGILPELLAAKPIAVFEFVHVKLAPTGELKKFVATTVPLLHITIFAGTYTWVGGVT